MHEKSFITLGLVAYCILALCYSIYLRFVAFPRHFSHICSTANSVHVVSVIFKMKTLVASAAVRFKTRDSVIVYSLFVVALIVGGVFLLGLLFCGVVLNVLSGSAVILLGKREQIVLHQ